jgi:hypothetical protein
VETSSDVDIQTEYDTGRVLFADYDPLVAYMDANNGTDALFRRCIRSTNTLLKLFATLSAMLLIYDGDTDGVVDSSESLRKIITCII